MGFIIGIILAVLFVAGCIWWLIASENKKMRERKAALKGLTLDVAFIQPNGSATSFESELINGLLQRSAHVKLFSKPTARQILAGEREFAGSGASRASR